ncbi:unnamed protein product [Calypogeia fissa]
MAKQLTPSILGDIATIVPVPTYDRADVRTAIAHFGVGNFHRSHQAMYVDALMNQGLALDWGICGVGVMPFDLKMRDFMKSAQSGLYTLLLKHSDATLEPRVIGSIHEYLYAPDDPEAVVAKLASPDIRIASLTVTEGGYNFDHVTGEFNLSNPGVVHDLSTSNEGPVTIFGLITEGLRRRWQSGLPPFTVMSCDNIQSNGNVARRSFLAFAEAKDPKLAQWISDEVRFPNSMVDRITPVTTDHDRKMVIEKLGIVDAWPVVCEPFTQWVLEDHFSNGRPPWELAGVQLVDNVEPYELMKLRLLNCSHQAMAYFGYLSGHRFVHEAMKDPLIVELLRRYMNDEATPTLLPVVGIDLDKYKATLLERFANPEIRDTLARLAAEASDRICGFLLPVVRKNLANGGKVAISAGVVASWARYAEGVDEQGQPYEVVDQLSTVLTARAKTQGEHPLAFIENEALFGDLAKHPEFAIPYGETLAVLKRDGAQAALKALLSS